MGFDVNIHDIECIKDLLKKQAEDIRKTLEFSESHPKLFKAPVDELKIYQELCNNSIDLLNDITSDFYEFGETEISVTNY